MYQKTNKLPLGSRETANKALRYLGFYSIIFILLSIAVFYPYILNNKSFIWLGDGVDQHFPVFYYLGEYYQNVLKLILRGEISQIPMMDFRVGFGFDVLTTFGYYGLGDPLVFLTVFAAPEHMEAFYNGVILLRLYLIGIAFMLYCFYMRLDYKASIIGAIIYVFCGYSIYASVRHPFFCIAMMYFPLLLLSVERLLSAESGKGLLLSVLTALAAISNFYFFYMLTVLTFLYGIIRFYYMHTKLNFKKTIQTFGRAFFYYMLGIFLSAAIFLPILIAYKNNARLQSFDAGHDWFYEFGYYIKVFYGLFSPAFMDDYWSILNLTPLALFAVIALFLQKKNYRFFKAYLILLLILLATPIGGSFMNGMGYVSNRWVWGISFWFALIVVLMLKKVVYPKSPFLPITTIVIGASSLLLLFYKPLQNIYVITGIILCILLLFMLIFKKRVNKNFHYPAILYFTIITIILNASYLYSRNYRNYVLEFVENNKVVDRIEETPLALKDMIQDNGFYRISTINEANSQNKSIVMNYYGTTTYYSITDKLFSEYCLDLELGSLWTLCRMDGFESRRALETLASTKYFFAKENDWAFAPYGFKEIQREIYRGNTSIIYENEYFLPLGYTYDSYISSEDYKQLTALEKQEAMLQGVVLTELPEIGIEKTKLTNTINSIPYTIIPNENVVIDKDKHTIEIKKKKVSLEIEFEGMPNSETYLRLNNFIIDNSGLNNFTLVVRDGDKSMSNKAYPAAKEYSVYSGSYTGAESYAFHLGYSEDSKNGCIIEFPEAGVFYLDDIEIYCITMENYPEQIAALKETVLENVVLSPNQMMGRIQTETDKMLCLNIPYSTGWKAAVDGKPTKIYQANGMYMGLALEAGQHEIRLYYRTPGLKQGLLISFGAMGISAALLIFQYYQNRRMKQRI